MPAYDGFWLDNGKVAPPIGENPGDNSPKCPIRWPESRSLGCPLKHIELMAKGDVLKGKLSLGFKTGYDGTNDDFEHQIMLYPGPHNRNDTNRTEYLGGKGVIAIE